SHDRSAAATAWEPVTSVEKILQARISLHPANLRVPPFTRDPSAATPRATFQSRNRSPHWCTGARSRCSPRGSAGGDRQKKWRAGTPEYVASVPAERSNRVLWSAPQYKNKGNYDNKNQNPRRRKSRRHHLRNCFL